MPALGRTGVVAAPQGAYEAETEDRSNLTSSSYRGETEAQSEEAKDQVTQPVGAELDAHSSPRPRLSIW